MKQKRFGIDIDGTVTSPDSLIPFINQDFQLNITLKDITKYDLTEALNIPEDIFNKWYTEKEPLIYKLSPIAEGAKEVLTEWKNVFSCSLSAQEAIMRSILQKNGLKRTTSSMITLN